MVKKLAIKKLAFRAVKHSILRIQLLYIWHCIRRCVEWVFVRSFKRPIQCLKDASDENKEFQSFLLICGTSDSLVMHLIHHPMLSEKHCSFLFYLLSFANCLNNYTNGKFTWNISLNHYFVLLIIKTKDWSI